MAPEPDAEARARHDRYREASGVKIVHVGDDPLASVPILGHLRRGGIVALKFDRVSPGMRTRSVDLFGEPWRMPEGPFRLAALSGAPLVPVLTRRLGFMDYEVTSYPAIQLSRRSSEAQRQAAAQRLADTLEGFIREHPTQWFPFGA
jgi:KDO2-lipid IV(A) lauroyltransferase